VAQAAAADRRRPEVLLDAVVPAELAVWPKPLAQAVLPQAAAA
jgi:hypothetical protein